MQEKINQPLESVKAIAVAAPLQCHSASGTFAVTETGLGLNFNIFADLKRISWELILHDARQTHRCMLCPSAIHWEKLQIQVEGRHFGLI
jgi:hypothetical protein